MAGAESREALIPMKEERSCKEERNVELYILYHVEDVLHNRAPVIYTVNGEER